jgi:hypothetical protein
MSTKTDKPKSYFRFGRNLTNKWFYREKTRSMPRMRNLPPYDSNEIVQWFATLYGCSLEQGRYHWESAKKLSYRTAKADPGKWPPFLIFDHETREFHGADTP